MGTESSFQAQLIKELRDMYPEAIVLKNDPNYLQGFPDITILFENTWAVLETKRSKNEPHRPNQDYYVRELNKKSFARFIYPENKEKVLDELQQAFGFSRSTRIPYSK